MGKSLPAIVICATSVTFAFHASYHFWNLSLYQVFMTEIAGMSCFDDRILIDPPCLDGIKVNKILITLENRFTHIHTNEKYKKILTSSPLKYMQVVKYIQVVCLKKNTKKATIMVGNNKTRKHNSR